MVAVLSGGNIDPLLMMRVIERGLAAAGRYLRFTVRCPDRPGQLAALLTLIGQQGANIDDVVHQRHDPPLRLGEVEVELSVETRGAEHSDRLVQALRDRRLRGALRGPVARPRAQPAKASKRDHGDLDVRAVGAV